MRSAPFLLLFAPGFGGVRLPGADPGERDRMPLVPNAPINGIDIYFERSGTGPPLLYLNGSGATLATSGMLLAPFAEGFDLLAHDQRGLGRTSAPDGPYTMTDYAEDAVALLDHVGWPTARVAGISFGGMVAQELAVTHPERVVRLALLCTSPGGEGGSSYPLHGLRALAPDERTRIGTTILDSRFTPEFLEAHPGQKLIADVMAERGAAERSSEVARGEALQLEARRHHDVWDRLPNITCPTFVAAGRYDGIAPPANAEAIGARVPGAEVHLYEGGHAFFVQDRSAIPEIIDWLAGGAR